MTATSHRWRRFFAAGGLFTLLGVSLVLVTAAARDSKASPYFPFSPWRSWPARAHRSCAGEESPPYEEFGGTWYWLRSPDEEKRIIGGLFNRYCIRCHGVDGRGVWDIPGVPNFTDSHWQASRSDAQLACIILEGRGAVMPPFRGTLSLEEAWAMARYLRSFIPGTEVARPEPGPAENAGAPQAPGPRKLEAAPK
jgi:cytochrome c oxidase cbb3-type subunit 3